MILTKQFFGVSVYLSLYLAREVKVNIRRLIAVKSEERFKRYIVTVTDHIYIAVRTLFRRQVKARAVRAVKDKFVVSALGSSVMRRQGVYLGDTSHYGNYR